MVSILEGKLAAAIAKGFKSKLLVGVLKRPGHTVVNERGNPVETAPIEYRVEGFVDAYSDFYRAQAGIPETDSRVILIAGNCETTPLKNDIVEFPNFPAFQINNVKTDPAKAHYDCQSSKC